MMLSWPTLGTPIEFEENRVEVLIVENPLELRRILTELQGQVSGMQGKFVLSKNFEPIDISKLVLLITDPLNLELDSKRTLAKLTQQGIAAASQLTEELQNVVAAVNHLAVSICNEVDFDISFTEVESADDIVKLMNFHLDRSGFSFPEQIIELLRMQRGFFGKQLFVLYNLKACMSTEELGLFYKEAFYNKLALLLVEDVQRSSEDAEHIMIIDKDLCII